MKKKIKNVKFVKSMNEHTKKKIVYKKINNKTKNITFYKNMNNKIYDSNLFLIEIAKPINIIELETKDLELAVENWLEEEKNPVCIHRITAFDDILLSKYDENSTNINEEDLNN
jgi:hypothetical protein